MYDSQEEGKSPSSLGGAASACRLPPNQFRVSFGPSNDYEKGMGVAVNVDGVLCTSKEAASMLMGQRLDELYGQWAEHVAKM